MKKNSIKSLSIFIFDFGYLIFAGVGTDGDPMPLNPVLLQSENKTLNEVGTDGDFTSSICSFIFCNDKTLNEVGTDGDVYYFYTTLSSGNKTVNEVGYTISRLRLKKIKEKVLGGQNTFQNDFLKDFFEDYPE